MSPESVTETEHEQGDPAPICPGPIDRKTGQSTDVRHPAYELVEKDGERRLVVRSYDMVRSLLRLSSGTRQAGFGADMVLRGKLFRPPTLYIEGAEHARQRRLAGRYFTPKRIASRHRQMLEELADRIVSELERAGGGRVEDTTFRMAMRVVCEVVGLTHSSLPALERLLERFFRIPPDADASRWVIAKWLLTNQASSLEFYVRHVRPAIRAHRAEPRDDVLGGLLDQELRDRDIVVECVTLAAAGMVTTRQFMAVAVWHLIERPELRERFRSGTDEERRAILEEIIRLETVAGHLLRRTTGELTVDTGDGELALPEGTLLDLDLRAANADAGYGDDALALNPDRCPAHRLPRQGLSFGAGHHSCPGEHLAFEETDVFLQRFFASEWELTGSPTIAWNELLLAYDIRGLQVRRLGPAIAVTAAESAPDLTSVRADQTPTPSDQGSAPADQTPDPTSDQKSSSNPT